MRTWQRPDYHSTEFDASLHQKFLIQSVPNFVKHLNAAPSLLSASDECRTADGQTLDSIRILMFYYLLRMMQNLASGDYMECGTFKGFSARLIWRWMDPECQLYCFDTFEGFSEPDIVVEHELYKSNWTVGNFQPTSVAEVRERILNGDETPADRLSIVKGWLPEAFQAYEGRRWRFAHLDMDLYLPHKEMIERVWPKLVPGGILMMHDYHNSGFPGVKQAADEYRNPLGISCVPLPDWGGSAVAIKPLR